MAILSAAISPACAFITGNSGSWIEICSGLNLTKIKIPNDGEMPDITKSGCEFCFQHFNMNGIETDVFTFNAPSPEHFLNNFQSE